MKIRPAIVIPVVSAIVIAGGLLVYLRGQLGIPLTAPSPTLTASVTSPELPSLDDSLAIGNDTALRALREGDLAAIRGDWQVAQLHYDEAVRNGAGLTGLRKLAQAQLQQRDLRGVLATAGHMRREGAKPEELLLLETAVKLRDGKVTEARNALEGAPDSPQKHYGLALIAIIEGNHDKAKEELPLVEAGWDPVLRTYAKLLSTAYATYAQFPESPEIHLITLLSRALAESQQCDLALPLLAQVTAEQDDYRDAWIVQGYCELMTNRSEAARASLERAYNLDPEKPEIQYFLARAYAAVGDHANAVTFGTFALKNDFTPKNEVQRFLAQEAEAAGDLALAIDQYRALSEEENPELSTFAKLASLKVAAGLRDDALVTAESSTQKWPEDAKSWELLGWVQQSMGRKVEAKQSYQKALELEPNLTSVKEKLGSL